MQNIILMGMMGCGKTTVGRLLSARLKMELADTDALIEAQEGRPIPEIFSGSGEAYFRSLEHAVSEELAERDGLIIACGGGLPMQDGAIAALKRNGLAFWLLRDPGETYDSLDVSGRPLAQEGRADFIARFERRAPVYRRWADHVIEARSPETAADAVAGICLGQ